MSRREACSPVVAKGVAVVPRKSLAGDYCYSGSMSVYLAEPLSASAKPRGVDVVELRCSEDDRHRWRAPFKSLKNSCPVCRNRVVIPGVNDLLTLAPTVAAEWHPSLNTVEPGEVAPSTHADAWWQCSADSRHVWKARIAHRVHSRSGCPVCSGNKIVAGVNDFASLRPELMKEWNPENSVAPDSVGQFSHRTASWICLNNSDHVWEATIANRSSGGGCPFCLNRLIHHSDSLASRFPLVAEEWSADNGLSAADVAPHARQTAQWVCKTNPLHTWETGVYNRTQPGRMTGCPHCAAASYVSRFEREVASYVLSLGIEIETTVRRFSNVGELDILVPGLNVAIECQGVFWHSEHFRPKGAHAAKRAACEALGIRLIQVWEDDWSDRRPIVERMLAHKLGFSVQERIAARTTTVRAVGTTEARAFLNANHIQGFTGATHHLGLEHDGSLVAVMSLKRTGKPGELRLERYATAAHVLGGQSKLIRYAEKTIPGWTRLVTFADHEVSDGSLYERTGWVKDGELAPDYKYLVRGQRVHKFNFRLTRFRSDPMLKFEEGLSERALARLNSIPRVWDSGKTRYLYSRKS